jgi:hypothetical protein
MQKAVTPVPIPWPRSFSEGFARSQSNPLSENKGLSRAHGENKGLTAARSDRKRPKPDKTRHFSTKTSPFFKADLRHFVGNPTGDAIEAHPNSSETRLALYCLKPHWGREVPVCLMFWGNLGGHPSRPNRGKSPNEKKNAQIEDTYRRSQALQQDWDRQNQEGPDEDAAHPYFEIAKSEA